MKTEDVVFRAFYAVLFIGCLFAFAAEFGLKRGVRVAQVPTGCETMTESDTQVLSTGTRYGVCEDGTRIIIPK